jgi:hypothetical protein
MSAVEKYMETVKAENDELRRKLLSANAQIEAKDAALATARNVIVKQQMTIAEQKAIITSMVGKAS